MEGRLPQGLFDHRAAIPQEDGLVSLGGKIIRRAAQVRCQPCGPAPMHRPDHPADPPAPLEQIRAAPCPGYHIHRLTGMLRQGGHHGAELDLIPQGAKVDREEAHTHDGMMPWEREELVKAGLILR